MDTTFIEDSSKLRPRPPTMKKAETLASRFSGVATTAARDIADIQTFFDRCAIEYAEQHGDPDRLLAYRLDLVRTHAELRPTDVVLDVGCGNGHHLLALAPHIRRGIGVDLSPGMIGVARARVCGSPWQRRLSFAVDNGEELAQVAPASVDAAICIGALEHMLDKAAVLASVYRVLRPGGRFFCLTPDGQHPWYRTIAPLLGLATKHLSTDRFLTRAELAGMLRRAGFRRARFGSWTFIPKGDMPPVMGVLLDGLDALGRVAHLDAWRGGLWVCAWKAHIIPDRQP
jgi:2-polyprenyl-6-hydroxyphenyl methylase/3-demethylubiquinone-9 3-methyltransferase